MQYDDFCTDWSGKPTKQKEKREGRKVEETHCSLVPESDDEKCISSENAEITEGSRVGQYHYSYKKCSWLCLEKSLKWGAWKRWGLERGRSSIDICIFIIWYIFYFSFFPNEDLK